MILDFSWLPPEINSARIFAGAGSGPLHVAAAAWESLAAELAASASSFDSVITGMASGPWAGPASASMVAAATPYIGWLSTAASQAQSAAAQARAAASAFETAMTATVHPAAVTANRVSLTSLVATNFLGQNTPAIAATEFDYVEMWAQDVAAMVGYHGGATAVAASVTPFAVPPVSLAGLATQVATNASAAVSPLVQGVTAVVPGLVSGVQSVAAAVPVQSLASVAQVGTLPASMLISPMMQLAQLANSSSASAGAAAATAGLADSTKFVGDVAPAAKGLGGAGLGAGMAGDLGKAHLVGAMSVPPTWAGSTPKDMASAAMRGVSTPSAAAAQPAAAPAGGMGMPMMPMPTGAGAAGGGLPGGMMGRGGGGAHVTQNRPSVVPRTGIG
ncbi:PPE family protein [Mycobacterium asiaticum]|uniref:PPE family domain-containing protein n=1 Tax=Mycobacterium asiaticum TaxID=1790 RepID=A0A1A3KR04_MYCAS|nr:PPE family protein [Mycobacterium asiaticum]OBI88815.1 hypothetical protein A5661_05010 [Mycobacterium asiaticum]OBJ86864.1 hypothetical protein A5640_09070 [Mycobacterium asiaticum]